MSRLTNTHQCCNTYMYVPDKRKLYISPFGIANTKIVDTHMAYSPYPCNHKLSLFMRLSKIRPSIRRFLSKITES